MPLKYFFLLVLCIFGTIKISGQNRLYNITAYGARPGITQNNTIGIQNAINAATANGGGKVIIPDGIFITGPLILKNGVELHLEDNAVLLGSAKRLDYNDTLMAVIYSHNQHGISITGHGIIDGQGGDLVQNVLYLLRNGVISDPQWLQKRPTEKNRPNIINFNNCSNISICGITLKNSANWVQSYSNCKNLIIDSIKVNSTAYWNNDGIDIVDSKNVQITNSFINSADDGICFKSDRADKACEDIVVKNCTIRSSASGFKFGTGSVGGFKNIAVSDLIVYNTFRSAIALEAVDGAIIENVNINHLIAKNTGNAIFIRLGHRNSGRYSIIRHIVISDIKAEIPFIKPDIGYPMEGPLPKIPPHNLIPASITGLPGHPVQDVTLNNIDITYAGEGNKAMRSIPSDSLNTVTENEHGYPEFTMFSELPAWGFYVRHAEGLHLNNIKTDVVNNDFRPSFVFDDVKILTLNNISVLSGTSPFILLNNVTKSSIQHLKMPGNDKNAIKFQ